jgi:hypothetical protein
MKNFIDFVADASKDHALAADFLSQVNAGDHGKLSAWLQTKGYSVSKDEGKKLIDHKDTIKSSRVGMY